MWAKLASWRVYFRRISRERIFCFRNTRHEASLVHAILTSWLRRWCLKMAQNISLALLEPRQGTRVALSATDGPSKRPLFAQESKSRAPKKPGAKATWGPQSGHCGEAQASQSVGKTLPTLSGRRRWGLTGSVTFSHPSGRGSPQDKKGNVFGHFQALTPQQGGQICVNQTGFMEGVFQKDFFERRSFASKTPVMKPVWLTQF